MGLGFQSCQLGRALWMGGTRLSVDLTLLRATLKSSEDGNFDRVCFLTVKTKILNRIKGKGAGKSNSPWMQDIGERGGQVQSLGAEK